MAKRAHRDEERPPVLAPDDDARNAARRVLAFHLAVFTREESAARSGDVEAVHQLRVATRRMRSTLRLFAPVLPAASVASAGDGFAWLARAIGAVRDLDVLALAVVRRGRKLDDSTRSHLGALERVIADRRAAALSALVTQLESPRSRRLLVRVGTLANTRLAARRPVRLGDVARDLVVPLLRAIQRSGRDLDVHAPPRAFHRLRKRVKRLRYASETLAGLGDDAMQAARGRLVTLQDVLGEHQDAIVQRDWLRACAESDALPPATLLAMGELMHALGRRTKKLRRRAPRAWKKFDRRRVRRQLMAGLDVARTPDEVDAKPERSATA